MPRRIAPLGGRGDTAAADCARYCVLARELGASDARPMAAAEVVVDERVTLKCCVPKCFSYNTCANCPPHAPAQDRMRGIVAQYRHAVALRLAVPAAVIVRDRATIAERVAAYQALFAIVDRVESAAFYDGHYLAVGFGAGSCRSTFCGTQPCAVLAGTKCRRALKARPSLEAVGIDAFRLAAGLGWEMHPIGSDAAAAEIPGGNLLGLVLVA
ncbi:MAG TPA: DUF2284 domain-containing protein [bacterium]|nr:DUF2284 domain-containing protein [bacterium]